MTGIFKAFGESYGLNDQFLTFAATFSMCFNCLARLTGGMILDMINFKTFYGLILVATIGISFTYQFVAHN